MRARIISVPLFVLALVAGTAAAQSPNVAFNGRIIASAKKFPMQAKSPSAYTAAIRKQASTTFNEDKAEHTWVIHLAAFLKAPLNDVEYSLKIYEIQGHTQQLLTAIDQYSDERGQRTIITKVKLEKKSIGVNKHIMVTVESKGKVLASSAPIKILGEGEHYSGKVNFSEDEAEGKDKDE